MVTGRDLQIIRMGSRVFPYSVPLIAHTKTYWYDLHTLFPVEMDFWDYLDSMTLSNNSALPLHFYLNSADNDYYVLPYTVQPVSRRSFRGFGVYNPDVAVDIAAGLIVLSMRRLPPDVTPVVNQS